MKRIYAVLDIGSTTLKLLVAELMSTNINILFTKKLASHAIEGGLIKNEEVLVDEIRSIIKEADAELNTTITSVALVLPSNYARTYQTKGITKVNSPQDKIEVSDIVRVLKIAQRFEKLGYKIYASRGTAKVLKEHGVNAIQVNKIGQEAPTLLDLILEHKIDLVIDTPENGIERAGDGFLIRRYEIETGVHCLTSLDTAHALISSLEHAFNNKDLTIVDIATIDNRK